MTNATDRLRMLLKREPGIFSRQEEADLRELLDAVEQLPAAAAEPADFFQAGKTYIEAKPFTAPEALTVFRCAAVDRFPGNGERAGKLLAFGFATRAHPGDHWGLYVCMQEAWSEGWNEYDDTPALAAGPEGA